MSQSSCFTNTFTLSDFVYPSVNALPLSKGSGQWIFNPSRPFIPYCGATLNANGVYIPDTIAQNVVQIATFVNFFKECRQASINEVQDVAGSEFSSDLFQGYLYKTTFANAQNFQRYLQLAGIIFEFWTNANGAWTAEQYFNALNQLVATLIQQADKNLYIPPGGYTLANASALALNLDAWKAANANFVGMLTLEFYQ